MVSLDEIKKATGITGDFQDDTLNVWKEEVIAFLKEAGVREDHMTAGIIARGVMDLWNLGSGDGHFSQYFMQRAAQLALKK